MIEARGFAVYYGDKSDSIVTPDSSPDALSGYQALQNRLGLAQMVFVRQVHKDDVYYVTSPVSDRSGADLFNVAADSIITSSPGVGIGVITADCLPIIVYEKTSPLLAVVHAGWRGSFLFLLAKTLARMKARVADPRSFSPQIFFGPAIGVCCYKVGSDFYEQALAQGSHMKSFFCLKKNEPFFDLIAYNRFQASQAGVALESVSLSYHACTSCSPRYASFRRDGGSCARNPTVALLKTF